MNEQAPDQSNRLAYWTGRIFHPYVLCVPVMLIALSGLTLAEAVKWSLLVAVIVLVPAISLIAFIHRRGKFIHQRDTRGPVYITTWISILICVGVLIALNAPKVLVAGLATLAVWTPLQMNINRYVTKISIHAAVTAGSAMGLLILGKLNSPALQIGTLAIVLLVAWARVTTKNHTLAQVLLGLAVGVGTVILVFPLALA
jgi:hypothetical protein